MRKDQCMHVRSRCLRACPANGAIVKYETASSTFAGQLYRCGY